MNEEQDFYVSIEEPQAVRREILESSKALLIALQNYEKIRLLRENKYTKMREFRIKIRELGNSLNELKFQLPKYDVNKFKKSAPEKTVARPVSPINKPSELESIERELDEIENKLESLNH